MKSAVLALVVVAFVVSVPVQADVPALRASVECAPAPGPGRVLCALTIQASSGKLVWVDAVVVRAPPFARPLRSRIGAQTGAAEALGTASAKLALVASEAGQGELQLRVRSVLCHEGPSGEWCGPEVVDVSGVVAVGSAAAPAP